MLREDEIDQNAAVKDNFSQRTWVMRLRRASFVEYEVKPGKDLQDHLQ